MTLHDFAIFARREESLPEHASRLRLRASCSVAALSFMLAAAGPAVGQSADDVLPDPLPEPYANPISLCPLTPVGGTITVNAPLTCNVDFGGYPGSPLNLLVTQTGSLNPPTLATIYNSRAGNNIGDITILGSLSGTQNLLVFAAGTASLGKITFGADSIITQIGGPAVSVDLRNLPLLNGGFENNGSISAPASAVLALARGTVNGSIVNNGTMTSRSFSFNLNPDVILNGDIVNTGALDITGTGTSISVTSSTVNGNIVNSGSITGVGAANVGAGIGVSSSAVSGSLSNSGTISGFGLGVNLNGASIAGGVVNGGVIAGNNIGISASGATTATIANLAGATISGALNALRLNSTSAMTVNNAGLLDGAVALNGPHTLNLNGTAARVTGAVTGTGVVNVNGAFASENTFAASAFNVNGGGVFAMNHSIAAPVTVANGGVLTLVGPQTVTGTIVNNGLVDVGNRTLSATGAYTQSAGAVFRTAIDYIGPGGYGQMKSAGALDVADGAVIFASFAQPVKYPNGTVIQNVLEGTGAPTQAGKIALVTQGQMNIPRYSWRAVWDGSNVDLVLDAYDGALPTQTLRTLLPGRAAVLGLMHQRFALLNAAMDYDCAQFDKYGVCLSIRARATGFGAQSTGAGAFNIALRLAERFRLGAFIDYQANVNSAAIGGYAFERVEAQDNRPTFGGYAGYSGSGYTGQALEKGLQLFVSGGLNFGKVSVTRAMTSDAMGYLDAQPGSGRANLDAWYVRGMAGYGIDVVQNLRLMPFVGLRYTDVTRGAYAEGYTQFVTQPLAYDAFYERLITGFGGAQLATMLTPSLGARVGLGAEVDFKRSANAYSGASAIAGLSTFGLDHGAASNGARPTATAGAFYTVAPNQKLFLEGAAGQQAWSSRGYATGMIGYQVAF